jgi:hypothetical protein
MSEAFFADGIADIAVVGGIVRIEFFMMTPDRATAPAAGESPTLQRVRTMTVAIPLAGFAGSLNMFDGLRQRLIADGVLKTRDDAAAQAAGKPTN